MLNSEASCFEKTKKLYEIKRALQICKRKCVQNLERCCNLPTKVTVSMIKLLFIVVTCFFPQNHGDKSFFLFEKGFYSYR